MRIARLVPSSKVQGRWLCHMEDGSILRVGENEVLAFSLYSGMDLDESTAADLAAAARKGALREKALNLISARPMSRKELLEKLTPRRRWEEEEERTPEEGEAEDAAAQVADWLEDLGYLNDAEYAKSVARHYSAKGYGQGKIQDELWKRGVPREYWDEAKESAQPPDAGIDAFLRQKLKGRPPDHKELKRASDALARRGYRWNEIKEGLRRYGAEIEEE
ncbi:Regulatory protein RecX [uncultured Eubacteriales bacterium]|uniref:Regulatory protein RecX n=1 Tax=uncultured Eubacteriales bacterium TaxID=172733 RepID=A0A212K9F6_9FIRM|nr:Regulatory protein RecX [uncultured Eubacteriales bacterium]